MKKIDIVYILKNGISSEELKYSLRSVCENFPYRRIIFVGGCPKDIVPDVYIPHEQVGSTKWEKVRSSLLKILNRDDLSEDFYLFNDDFYILKKMRGDYINFSSGTLDKRVREIEVKFGRITSYSRQLRSIETFLRRKGKDTMSFAVHMPMLLNKQMALDLLKEFPKIEMFRSFYGNYYKIPFVSHDDVKIYDLESEPRFDDFLSTTDESFKDGRVGEWIRKRFPEPCKYEIQDDVFKEDENEKFDL